MPHLENLDAIVDEFDAAWHSGNGPGISEFLLRVSEENRDQLLEQLLPIEIEYRLKSGQKVAAKSYQGLGERAEGIAADVIDRVTNLLQSSLGKGDSSAKQSSLNDDVTIPPSNDPDVTIPPQQYSEHADGTEPKQIDQYTLLKKIGEGGMGSVWLAQQQEPVVRQVALKLIRADVGSSEAIARFEAERQALAMMDSDNIAKVLDGGTAANGNPYFVMELVDGVPLNEYCDQKKLSIRDRLQLMVDISNAIQHAHQKGIIHRDLKPSNVLITENNGNPVPKVIDFGLAKALEHTTRLTDKTMQTEIGQVVGTLQYMSPEQAAMDAVDIDTRTDIYSLGVMLYELLTGSTPIEADVLKKNALLKVLEVIREKEPPRPSHRLSSTENSGIEVSRLRQINAVKLRQILRGDLDWIVMKSLDKDRGRRYATASEFSDDIIRFLNHEPIIARPPSASYQIRKFARKNRSLVAATTTFILLLMAGIGGTAWFAYKARQAEADAQFSAKISEFEKLAAEKARDEAQNARKEAEDSRDDAKAAQHEAIAARDTAERARLSADIDRKTAVEVKRFLEEGILKKANIFAQANQARAKTNSDMTVKDALLLSIDEYNPETIENKFDRPEVQAEILETIAETASAIELHNVAIQYNAAAISIRESNKTEPLPAKLVVAKMNQMFYSLVAANITSDVVDTRKHYINCSRETADFIKAIHDVVHLKKEDFENGEEIGFVIESEIDERTEQIFQALAKRLDPKNLILPSYTMTGLTINDVLEIVRNIQFTFGQIKKLNSQLVERYPPTNGVLDQRVIYSRTILAFYRFVFAEIDKRFSGRLPNWSKWLLPQIGSFKKVVEEFGDVLKEAKKAIGEEDPRIAGIQSVLAIAKERLHGFDESVLGLHRKSFELLDRKLGYHPATWNALLQLATAAFELNKYETAIQYQHKAMEMTKAFYGNEPRTAVVVGDLAVYYEMHARRSELGSEQKRKVVDTAKRLYVEAIAMCDPDSESGNPVAIRESAVNYAMAIEDFEWALKLYEGLWPIHKKKLERNFEFYSQTISFQGLCSFRVGEFGNSVKLLTESLNLRQKHYDTTEHPLIICHEVMLIRCHERLGNNVAADEIRGRYKVDDSGELRLQVPESLKNTPNIRYELRRFGWTFDSSESDKKSSVARFELAK